MVSKLNSVISEISQDIKIPLEENEFMNKSLQEFISKLKNEIKKSKIDAQVFVGGSFAKKTLIKKELYDADVFVRFSKKYGNEISNLTKKLLKSFSKFSEIHGSREYFQVKISDFFVIEVIPVIKISKPEESNNTTDFSYLHVQYFNSKASAKILEDIKLAKVFVHASGCYGAESYIKGFSGYSLELLILYYGSFEKFVKAMSKIKNKEVIDIEKAFSKKENVLLDLNESKLISPIVLVDPTYRYRNALAALSEKTFRKFQKFCLDFLQSPDKKFFEKKKVDLDKLVTEASRKKQDFVLVEFFTKKQEGDVAGSKLLKFYEHLEIEISKYFLIKKSGFNYNFQKSARAFFVGVKRKDILFEGPLISDETNLKKFKKIHQEVFLKNKKSYAREEIKVNLNEFLKAWFIKNKKKVKEMYISKFKIFV